MKMQFKATCLALLGGAASLLAPAEAANVGYHGQCYPGNPSAQITAAGHTPVAIGTANAASLSGLSMLFAETCGSLSDPAVAAAVANGMVLIVHDSGSTNGAFLPGGANLVNASGVSGADIDFAVMAPFLFGPGGTLTNTSLDYGSSSNHGAKTPESLPAGSTVWATTANPAHVVTFTYAFGAGQVIFSTIPLQCYLGSQCAGLTAVVPGMKTYATNLIACALDSECTPPPSTTCASEGYTGTKLEWCKNVCERGYTGSTLAMWIRRWTDRYRTLPYCAMQET